MTCVHRVVVPVFPFHLNGWRSEVTGVCVSCDATDFVVWEAYGYGDANEGLPLPTTEDVLVDFESFWESLARFGYAALLSPPEVTR